MACCEKKYGKALWQALHAIFRSNARAPDLRSSFALLSGSPLAGCVRAVCMLNFDGGEEEKRKIFKEEELRRRRRRWVDWVHAEFGVLVFLALAMSDADVQSCFFQDAGPDAKELLVNLPLGAGVFASLVFMVFPTTRKGIGYSDVETHS